MLVGELARSSQYLRPQDSLGKAAELLRHSNYAALPVVDGSQVVGMVFEKDVFMEACWRDSSDGNSARSEGDCLRVGDVMRTNVVSIESHLPVQAAADAFRHLDAAVLPVVDSNGALRGLVSRADVASALCRSLRPPRVGGMATPIGVHLTTGNLRGGVSDIGLVLTGVMMWVCFAVAQLFLYVAFHIHDELTGSRFFWSFHAGQLDWFWLVGTNFAQVFTFFAVMRLLPLSGYHGAEHQVVHAIERGEEIERSIVSTMPLVHPRCGTNIAALMLSVFGILAVQPELNQSPITPWITIGLLVVVFLTWRRLGMLLQRCFTTKAPSAKQLESALRAGCQLLELYQNQINYKASIWRTIWNLGFTQVLIGFLGVWGLSTSGLGWLLDSIVEHIPPF